MPAQFKSVGIFLLRKTENRTTYLLSQLLQQ